MKPVSKLTLLEGRQGVALCTNATQKVDTTGLIVAAYHLGHLLRCSSHKTGRVDQVVANDEQVYDNYAHGTPPFAHDESLSELHGAFELQYGVYIA